MVIYNNYIPTYQYAVTYGYLVACLHSYVIIGRKMALATCVSCHFNVERYVYYNYISSFFINYLQIIIS